MKIYLVGGAVRDQLLGLPISDKDWVVVDSHEKEMLELGFKKVGKNFPVFLHPVTHEEYALARKEKKTGLGYHGFDFRTVPKVSLFDDLIRRDLTISAMARDTTGILYDPFGGAKDIEKKILKHTSNAFCEDPLRVIRVARFAARFSFLGFTIAKETLSLIRKMVKKNELSILSGERIYHEICKAFSTKNPEIFFQVLHQVEVFKHIILPLQNLLIDQKKIFLPLVKATKLNCSNIRTLFTLFMYQVKKQDDIVEISNILKLPKELTRLIIDTHCYHNMINKLTEYNSYQILKILKKTNALRSIKHMRRVIKICYFIAKSDDVKNPTVGVTLKIIKTLHSESYKSIIKLYKPDRIGKQIKKKQLTLIENTLHKLKD